MTVKFQYDIRLGISVPLMIKEWDNLTIEKQESILEQWENIRGNIPDRIKELEHEINALQQDLYEENNFEKSCTINSNIAELASTINDLWIWYRTSESITEKIHS